MKYYVLCLPLVLGSMAFAKPDATGDAKKAIEKAYSQMSKDFVNKRFAEFSGFMTKDFKASGKGRKGEFTREQVVKEFSMQRGRLDDVKWTKKVEKFDLKDGVAHALVEGKMTAATNFNAGKPQRFDLQAESEDDWVKVGTSWKLKSSHTTTFNVKIDGNLIPMH